jgi:hypothetical protein
VMQRALERWRPWRFGKSAAHDATLATLAGIDEPRRLRADGCRSGESTPSSDRRRC